MQYQKITDLTDDEVRFIINEIYRPEKITRIIRKKRKEEVIVRVKTRWHTTDDDGKDVYYLDTEELTLKDPFRNRIGLEYDQSTYSFSFDKDQEKFKQFCLAKGICYLLKDNPYM